MTKHSASSPLLLLNPCALTRRGLPLKFTAKLFENLTARKKFLSSGPIRVLHLQLPQSCPAIPSKFSGSFVNSPQLSCDLFCRYRSFVYGPYFPILLFHLRIQPASSLLPSPSLPYSLSSISLSTFMLMLTLVRTIFPIFF